MFCRQSVSSSGKFFYHIKSPLERATGENKREKEGEQRDIQKSCNILRGHNEGGERLKVFNSFFLLARLLLLFFFVVSDREEKRKEEREQVDVDIIRKDLWCWRFFLE